MEKNSKKKKTVAKSQPVKVAKKNKPVKNPGKKAVAGKKVKTVATPKTVKPVKTPRPKANAKKEAKKKVAAVTKPEVEKVVQKVEMAQPEVETTQTSEETQASFLKKYTEAVGRRKTSVARVRLAEGKGLFLINDRPATDYFSGDKTLMQTLLDRPFSALGRRNKFDVVILVHGGGLQSQMGAVLHGISRALALLNPEFHSTLRKAGYLTRDSRMKERRKYGLMGARKHKSSPKR